MAETKVKENGFIIVKSADDDIHITYIKEDDHVREKVKEALDAKSVDEPLENVLVFFNDKWYTAKPDEKSDNGVYVDTLKTRDDEGKLTHPLMDIAEIIKDKILEK